jgi:hypothetical protein
VLPAGEVSGDTTELSEAAQGSGIVRLRTPPPRTDLATHHATRNGTAGLKVLDDAPQRGLGVARDPELPSYNIPRTHAQRPYENPLTPGQSACFAALAKTFDHRAQCSTTASYEDQGGSIRSHQEIVRAGSSRGVISYNLHLQRRPLARKLSKHRPEPAHDGPTVPDPGGPVDDQQDSSSCRHRILSRLPF